MTEWDISKHCTSWLNYADWDVFLFGTQMTNRFLDLAHMTLSPMRPTNFLIIMSRSSEWPWFWKMHLSASSFYDQQTTLVMWTLCNSELVFCSKYEFTIKNSDCTSQTLKAAFRYLFVVTINAGTYFPPPKKLLKMTICLRTPCGFVASHVWD